MSVITIKGTDCRLVELGKLADKTGGQVGFYYFLVHQIRISEILPWDRKSHLTHVILPRLSREGYIHWLYLNSRTWSSNDDIDMLK